MKINKEKYSSEKNDDLHNHLAKLCMSPRFSDITIQIEGIHIHAHKVILSRNGVFERMLTSDMLESKNNIL